MLPGHTYIFLLIPLH